MALTLEQYASYLDTRDLSWPAPPEVERARARPHLVRLTGVRAVAWNVYGTLLAIGGGELYLQHPQAAVMTIALEKTVDEFKMWNSMPRKPGQPFAYLQEVYERVIGEQQTLSGGVERYPEVALDRVWEAIIKKLLQKEYTFNTGLYGALNEFSRKVAYFFHARMQGTACCPGAAAALEHGSKRGLAQGLLADAQCFTLVQLQRGLTAQDPTARVDDLLAPDLRSLSHEVLARKPSERLFRHALGAFKAKGFEPEQVLCVGSRVALDVMPAKRMGFKTALYAGDRASLAATPEQLKEPASRPDVLLTELAQIADVVG
jgi:hypothetical protein